MPDSLSKLVIAMPLAAAMMLAATPGHAAWWNIFDRDRKEVAPPPAASAPADPVQLQTAPLQSTPAQPAPGPAAPMQAAPSSAPPPAVGPTPPAVAGRTPPLPVGTGNTAVETERLQTRIRELTGQVEALQHQLGELREILLRVQEDNESRLQALEGGAPDGATMPELKSQLDKLGEPMDGAGEAAGKDAAVQSGPGAPPRLLGTLSGSEAAPAASGDPNAPMNLAALARSQPASVTDAAPTEMAARPAGESPQVAYDRAYSLVVAGDYAPAEKSLRAFLAAHPQSDLAADAQYWLGETYFAREDYKQAADSFLVAYRTYPDGRKAPDTLLKLGLSLHALGESRAACSTYAELLGKHKNISNALLQRVRAEQARANC